MIYLSTGFNLWLRWEICVGLPVLPWFFHDE
jgi:hypothetical protein